MLTRRRIADRSAVASACGRLERTSPYGGGTTVSCGGSGGRVGVRASRAMVPAILGLMLYGLEGVEGRLRLQAAVISPDCQPPMLFSSRSRNQISMSIDGFFRAICTACFRYSACFA